MSWPRSTTCWPIGPTWESWSTRCRVFAGCSAPTCGIRSGEPPLTPAELPLLPYLQTHLGFREIGERLFLSRNTAATQVGSIYRKLGVSSRSAADERATTVGLLGG
ncbi:MAG TPA: LuxR C-terminal-related transcriptional regulator [Microlunatus sp.]|nr:LuxR C-terminal-related transcriptional regulator [Microlunatus sp.]